jgi:hypothetical protein
MKVVLGREEGGGGLLWAEAAVWWALWGGGGLVAGGWFTFGYFGYYMGPWGGGSALFTGGQSKVTVCCTSALYCCYLLRIPVPGRSRQLAGGFLVMILLLIVRD